MATTVYIIRGPRAPVKRHGANRAQEALDTEATLQSGMVVDVCEIVAPFIRLVNTGHVDLSALLVYVGGCAGIGRDIVSDRRAFGTLGASPHTQSNQSIEFWRSFSGDRPTTVGDINRPSQDATLPLMGP